MPTLEERYELALREAWAGVDDATEKSEIKWALWEKFQAEVFLRDGEDPGTILKFQRQMAVDFLAAIKAFYEGRVSSEGSHARHTVIFREYCERMVKLELAISVPRDTWIKPFVDDGILMERTLLPVSRTKLFTDEDADLLCVPLRNKSKEFILAFHSQYGIGRLKDTPDIYVGIDLAEHEITPDADPKVTEK